MEQLVGILTLIILGAILGSFASFLSYRLATDESLVSARSKCTSCKHKLSALDLIPIFSNLFLKGKCRYCDLKLSPRYLIIEFSAIFLTLIFAYIFTVSLDNLFLFIVLFLLFIAIITDLEHYIIPEFLQIMLVISASLFAYLNHYSLSQILLQPLCAWLFGFLLKYSFLKIRKKDGLGFADITLFYVVTIFLGLKNFYIFLSISGLLGIIFGIIWQHLKKSQIFPFAPALILSFIICLILMKSSDSSDLFTYFLNTISFQWLKSF